MVDSPACKFCLTQIETVKHVLWSCPRTARAWEYLKGITMSHIGSDYITYNTVIVGNPEPNMAMETMITWVTKLILAINREEIISNEVIQQKFQTLFYYEQKTFGLKSKKMRARWGNLLDIFKT